MIAYFRYLMRTWYFRILLTAYAFFVFMGMMPKAPPRGRFQGVGEHLFLTVSNSLGGFVALGVLVLVVFVAWAGIATAAGQRVDPAPVSPDPAAKDE